MDSINHFESETPCYRVAHDGERTLSITHASGKTSSRHQILTGESWEEVAEKLDAEGIALGDLTIPEPEPKPTEQ